MNKLETYTPLRQSRILLGKQAISKRLPPALYRTTEMLVSRTYNHARVSAYDSSTKSETQRGAGIRKKNSNSTLPSYLTNGLLETGRHRGNVAAG